MASAKLGKKVADAAEVRAKAYILYDSDLPGFGLRVMPSGYKSWLLEYRPGGGGRKAPNRRMVIGPASTLTAEQARRMARDTLASVRLGADPAASRQVARQMPSVAELAARFLREFCTPPRIKPRTAKLYSGNLKHHIGPALGSIKIDQVKNSDVVRMHRRIGKKGPTAANNVLVTLASLYKYAAAEGLISENFNPARGVQRFKTRAKERFLSQAEFARLGEALRLGESVGLPWAENKLADPGRAKHRPKHPENARVFIPQDVAAALRLLIFTGCRKSEILGLRWSEVDFERGLLHLSDSKTGRRMVVLNAPALAILAELPRTGAFVFPGSTAGSHRNDLTGYWYRVRQQAGLNGSDGVEAVRLHDLRHSYASLGVSGGMGLPIIGKLLGHTQAATTSRYAHLDADPVRLAAERIGRTIEEAMGDKEHPTATLRTLRSVLP